SRTRRGGTVRGTSSKCDANPCQCVRKRTGLLIMRRVTFILIGAGLTVMLMATAGLVYLRATGLDAMAQPGTLETRLARAARRLAIPSAIRTMANPTPRSAESVADGMAHFADHCAVCH